MVKVNPITGGFFKHCNGSFLVVCAGRELPFSAKYPLLALWFVIYTFLSCYQDINVTKTVDDLQIMTLDRSHVRSYRLLHPSLPKSSQCSVET